ncbi:MAG: NUDIX domain-containing protein [Alphaproteobacteria bacterium]|nr:NUDIX domain-containing protein [Alphaproteobacteria bacterium]
MPSDLGDRSYPQRPFVGVGAVIFKESSVLLIKRGRPPRQGQWSLPGGLQHLGETVFETARREIKEETGLDISPNGLVEVVDSITRDDDGRVRYHYTLVDIWAEWRSGEVTAGDDAAACAWVELDDIERYDLWSETVRVIMLALTCRRTKTATN